MELPAAPVFDCLAEHGITSLYHANTVRNAAVFLRRMQLVSQGTMARLGLRHSPQASDPIDRKSGIYFDVFLGLLDIHAAARRPNVYGPVLFELAVDAVKALGMGTVWVTRRNPIHWPELPEPAERWFQSPAELLRDLDPEEFDHMLAIRSQGGILPLAEALQAVVLDDPLLENDDGVRLYDAAWGALTAAIAAGGRTEPVPIQRRTCPRRCGCAAAYHKDHTETARLFMP